MNRFKAPGPQLCCLWGDSTVLSQFHPVNNIKLCFPCHSEEIMQEVGLCMAGSTALGLQGVIKEQNQGWLTEDCLECFNIPFLPHPHIQSHKNEFCIQKATKSTISDQMFKIESLGSYFPANTQPLFMFSAWLPKPAFQFQVKPG